MAQREEVIKRTVYVSDIDQQVKVMLACVLPFFFSVNCCFGFVFLVLDMCYFSSCFEFRSLRKILLLFLSIVAR